MLESHIIHFVDDGVVNVVDVQCAKQNVERLRRVAVVLDASAGIVANVELDVIPDQGKVVSKLMLRSADKATSDAQTIILVVEGYRRRYSCHD